MGPCREQPHAPPCSKLDAGADRQQPYMGHLDSSRAREPTGKSYAGAHRQLVRGSPQAAAVYETLQACRVQDPTGKSTRDEGSHRRPHLVEHARTRRRQPSKPCLHTRDPTCAVGAGPHCSHSRSCSCSCRGSRCAPGLASGPDPGCGYDCGCARACRRGRGLGPACPALRAGEVHCTGRNQHRACQHGPPAPSPKAASTLPLT